MPQRQLQVLPDADIDHGDKRHRQPCDIDFNATDEVAQGLTGQHIDFIDIRRVDTRRENIAVTIGRKFVTAFTECQFHEEIRHC